MTRGKDEGGMAYRVLVIDDDKLARNGLISIVPWEECGMEVVGNVANGMAALEFLKSHSVDLAVVDLSMPVLSGMDFIRKAGSCTRSSSMWS